jgi:putative flippase GtrA
VAPAWCWSLWPQPSGDGSTQPRLPLHGLCHVATACNLAAQRAVLALSDGAPAFMLALAVGTGVGLVVKYILDKRWIFGDADSGLLAH